jgi:hypothetical protein
MTLIREDPRSASRKKTFVLAWCLIPAAALAEAPRSSPLFRFSPRRLWLCSLLALISCSAGLDGRVVKMQAGHWGADKLLLIGDWPLDV